MDIDGILNVLTHERAHARTRTYTYKIVTFILTSSRTRLLPYSLQPITEPYPKLDESNPHRHIFISKPV
jgi:hypothetical protein